MNNTSIEHNHYINDKEEITNNNNQTKRLISKDLEDILHSPIHVLDKGFIRVIDYMGNDSAIVQAARVSYGDGTKHLSQDASLINYLMRHQHTSPFEMCEIKFHIKLPIFVARQWIRHRTANVNEYSARYSILKDEFYIPKIENIKKQSKYNKQGSEDILEKEDAENFIDILTSDSELCYNHYSQFLSKNVSREISRMTLTLNYYTEWYWKIDLHNLLHFIKLREDKRAQYEIREYASILLDIVKKWTPITYNAFVTYVKDAITLSKYGADLLKKKMKGEDINNEELNLSKTEFNDIMKLFEELES